MGSELLFCGHWIVFVIKSKKVSAQRNEVRKAACPPFESAHDRPKVIPAGFQPVLAGETGFNQQRGHYLGQFVVGLPTDMHLVKRQEFFFIEDGVGGVEIVGIEDFNQFVNGIDFAVSLGRPSQQTEIVEHRFGEDSLGTVLVDVLVTKSLGDFFPIRPKNHRQMPKARLLPPQGMINMNLLESVGDMVIAPNDVRDSHVVIVNDHGQVISCPAVGAGDNQIFDLLVAARQRSRYHILKGSLTIRYFQTNSKLPTGVKPFLDLGLGKTQAPSVVVERSLFGAGLLPRFFQFLGSAETSVAIPAFQDLPCMAFVNIRSLGLVNNLLVPRQAKPF